jgi:hypothetical protein
MDPEQLAAVVERVIKAAIAPLGARVAATETALAAFQATIAQVGAKDVPALERRVEALQADVGTVREKVAAVEVKTLQPGPPGPAGKDGVDGVGFDDFEGVDDGTGFALAFRHGDQVKSVPVPIPYDRGTYKADETYAKGNCVNDGGYWTAKTATKGVRPGTSPQAWRLLVHPKSYK